MWSTDSRRSSKTWNMKRRSEAKTHLFNDASCCRFTGFLRSADTCRTETALGTSSIILLHLSSSSFLLLAWLFLSEVSQHSFHHFIFCFFCFFNLPPRVICLLIRFVGQQRIGRNPVTMFPLILKKFAPSCLCHVTVGHVCLCVVYINQSSNPNLLKCSSLKVSWSELQEVKQEVTSNTNLSLSLPISLSVSNR